MKTKKFLLLSVVFLICFLLCACEAPAFLQSAESKVTELSGPMTAEEIAELDIYENLASLDLSGSTCYDAIMSYIDTHPSVDVNYTVEAAGVTLPKDVSELDFVNASNYKDVIAVGKYLPDIRSIPLGDTDMSLEEMDELRAAFPSAEISYTVNVLGSSLPSDVTELDFAGLNLDELNALLPSLEKLPDVDYINLVSSDGTCVLTVDDFVAFAQLLPDVFFEYRFELFGKTVSTSDTELTYDLVPIGNRGVPEFRKVMPFMKKLTYLLLDCCGISNYELLGQLNEDFPDTEVVWRVRMGEYDCLTNAEMIWLNAGVNDELCEPLKYCTKCRYLDLGHNDLHNIDFCSYMPDLEVAIFAFAPMESIAPLANCPKLEYLEIYATGVNDLSPLANCKELQHINFGSLYTIKDISPLYGLTKLKRCRSVSSGVPVEQQEEIKALLPDCDCQFGFETSTGGNWRRDPDTGLWCERYALLRQQFKYDNHEGCSRTYKYDLYVD